jgi:glycosyltransferase 2 family protein
VSGLDGLGPALVVLGASTGAARSAEVHDIERRAFRAVNDLPSSLHPPIYVVMQSGSLGAVFVAAGVARAAGYQRLALTMAVAGTGVWGAAKAMKRWVGRHRPARILDDVQVRGNEESGLGFPSGHAAVAFCLTTLLAPGLPGPARPFAWGLAAAVATSRMYVGAHLPLDIVGGAALGILGGQGAYAALDATRP